MFIGKRVIIEWLRKYLLKGGQPYEKLKTSTSFISLCFIIGCL
jgi:hypothetical protein